MTTVWPSALRGRPPRARIAWQSARAEDVLFAALVVLYLGVGCWLVLGEDSVMEDALSRVANASYVLFSREPKLVNVGFVWTPLPSLLFLPFLPLRYLWSPLVAQGLLATVLSAVAMAATARVLCGLLADLAVPRRVRITVAALFGVQPLIVWFGANGMTEALLLLFVLSAARRLVRWTGDTDARHLMAAGVHLALGYLARYEVLAAGAAAVCFVSVLSWRLAGERVAADGAAGGANRRQVAIADALLVGAPLAAVFLLWAGASWVIVGHPFDQFSSVYGNSALVDAGGSPAAPDPWLIPGQWWVLAPLLAPVLVLAVVRAVRRRDLGLVPPVALLAALLAFASVTYFAGSLFGFLRYQIAVIPLFAVLAGVVLRDVRFPTRLSSPVTAAVGAGALLAAGVVTSAHAFLTDPRLATQEWAHVRPAVQALAGDPRAGAGTANGAYEVDRRIAAYLDAKGLPPGSVVVDSAPGFAVLAATTNLRQFVITSDRDFDGAVVDPVGHGVRYLLVNRSRSQFDEVASTWPDLARGTPERASWARLEREFPSGGQAGAHEWALWRVEPGP